MLMSKQLTCVEIISDMRRVVPGYPLLVKQVGTGKEFVFLINTEGLGGWDLYRFKSHGRIFTRVAKGFDEEKVLQLIKLLNPISYEMGQY